MPTIQVKAKPGRVAYSAPRGGKLIPTDKYVSVVDSPFIRRLIEVQGDLLLKKDEPKKEEAKVAAPPKPNTTT